MMNLPVFSHFFQRFQIFLESVFLKVQIINPRILFRKHSIGWLFTILLAITCLSVNGQMINQVPLKKPSNFKDKILRSEKTEQVNLTLPRRLYHGMVSHYNYYYNAQTKLNSIVQKAQIANQEDFTKLLPFYDFSLSVTSADSIELDSVMMKATAGIVLHDLRNSYIDDLFLLIGKAYYYWDKPDSAYHIFQYINYNFYPNKKDAYRTVIGGVADAKNGQVSVGSKEKKGVIRKTFSKPPARNEALMWLAKIYAEQDMHDEAVSLIYLLKKDQLFPKRLHPQLDETLAFSFYNRSMWDSSAFYLKKSLSIEKNPARLARKEFLLAQLYALSDQSDAASVYYDRAKTHTNDPVMHIHARLNNALLANKNNLTTDESLNQLLKLTKKERFDGYEDLLFFAAADVALQKKDTSLAYSLLEKSARYSQKNPQSTTRNLAFLKLGQLALQQKNYRLAANSYDSLNLQDPQLSAEAPIIEKTKTILNQLVRQEDIVIKEDSLRRIAAMPEEELESYLKTLLKRLRKEKGLKEDASNITSGTGGTGGTQTSPNSNTDLFSTSNNTGWYFNVNNQKNKGPAEFKNKWGSRPNMDNWRRQAAIDASIMMSNQGFPGNPGGDGDVDNPISVSNSGNQTPPDQDELTIESLRYNLPLTDEKVSLSDQSIFDALLSKGNILKNQLEDYEGAANVYKELLKRFPGKDSSLTITRELYYCLLKTGNQDDAEYYKNILASQNTQDAGQKPQPDMKTEEIAKASYEQIYLWYLEGSFEKARKNKIQADSTYGTTYWTPQLMYIEAVYFAHNKQDSAALDLLNQLITRYENNAIAEKAIVLQDVIRRRNEIEQHLRESKIVRVEEPVKSNGNANPKEQKNEQPVKNNPQEKQPSPDKNTDKSDKTKNQINTTSISGTDSTKNNSGNLSGKQENQNKPQINTDSLKLTDNKPVVVKPTETISDSCFLMIALINVYPVYRNECQATMSTYLKTNTLSGIKEVQPTLANGTGNYGWILFDKIHASKACETGLAELKTIVPAQLYYMPADKYKILSMPASAVRQLESTQNVDDFLKVINTWIKD